MSSATTLMSPQRLVCVGGIPVDIVVRTPGIPVRGGDVRTTPVVDRPGGPFTVLSAATRLGMKALYAGGHGSGVRGAQVRAELVREGIEILRPPSTEKDTGFALVMVDPGGERTCVWAPGAEALETAADVAVYQPLAGDAVHVTGYDFADPAGRDLIAHLQSMGSNVLVFFDPGPLAASVPPGFSYRSLSAAMQRADVVSMNRTEAQAIVGDLDLRVIARELAPSWVIVRAGAEGAWLLHGDDEPYHAAAPVVQMVDATGAGDTHAGAFLAGLSEGLEPRAALHLATVAAALSVRSEGPATGPTHAEVSGFLPRRL